VSAACLAKKCAFEGCSGLATAQALADVVVVLLRQHIVALMRPIAFAAAQLNVVLHDGAVSPIPAIPSFELDSSATHRVAAPAEHAERAACASVNDGDDMVGGEVAGRAA
jgi:hypothetical protein